MSSRPSRSSGDRVAATLYAATDRILDAALTSHAVVLIDGRSGAGKSTLTRLLAARWQGPLQIVALDALYPGWDGLDAGTEIVLSQILAPRARGEHGVWRRWDWEADRPAEQHRVDPAQALIVEGSGILTAETAALADVTVWLESPEDVRRERALERDGDAYRPYWSRWAMQEERHIARHEPRTIAQIVVDVP